MVNLDFPQTYFFPGGKYFNRQRIFTSNPDLAPQYKAASWQQFLAPTSLDSSKSETAPTSNI